MIAMFFTKLSKKLVFSSLLMPHRCGMVDSHGRKN